MKCPNCGNTINNDSVFCSSCGRPLPFQKRTKFPLVGGILTVISSGLAIVAGTVMLVGAWLEFNINNQIYLHGGLTPLPFPTYFLSVGIFSIITFALGLFAGLAAINRKFVMPTTIGVSLLAIAGIIICIPINSKSSWEIGLPIATLSIASLILVLKSKPEFR